MKQIQFAKTSSLTLIVLTLLALCLNAVVAQAQSTTDTTEIQVGKKVIRIVSEDDDTDFSVVRAEEDEDEDDDEKELSNVKVSLLNMDLGMNFLMYDNSFNIPNEYSSLEIKPLNSTHFALHLLTTRINLIDHHVNLVSAITFDNNRFAFRDPITLIPDRDSLTIAYPDTVFQGPSSFEKNKLISWHAQIPVMLNFQTNPENKKKNFHLSVGGYAGLLLSAKTKQKSNELGKVKRSDDYNLNNFRYGLTARVGYRGLELYTNYNLSPMFREDQGPALAPITFGISLTGMM